MENLALRKKLIQQIKTLDDFSINRISKMLEDYKNEIVAYDTSGNPLTLSKYNDMVEEGLEDIRMGRVTSHEDFLKEMKSWDNE